MRNLPVMGLEACPIAARSLSLASIDELLEAAKISEIRACSNPSGSV
jgi:hypothetical protein